MDRAALVAAIVADLAASIALIEAVDRTDMAALRADGLATYKVVSEIALLLVIAKPLLAATPAASADARRLATWAVGRNEAGAFLDGLDRYPQTASSVGLLLLAARAWGAALPAEERIVAAFRAPGFLAGERMPFRRHEALWLRERVTGIAADWPGAIANSLFALAPHPATLSRDDLYALTHSAMYVTDFGARPLDDPALAARLARCFHHAIALTLCNADWDLAGELAMACRYLRLPTHPAESVAEAMLVSIHARHGCVPGLGFEPDRHRALAGDAAALYRLAHSYHTTLVLALLLAAPAPPPAPPAAPAPTCALDDADSACAAILAAFGPGALDHGCLDPAWFDDDVDMGWDLLIDGHAIRTMRAFGRERALGFLDAIPGALALALPADTHAMLRGDCSA